MTTASADDVQELANELAGNWRRFDSFAWFRRDEIDDPDNWAIIYTHNRDSGLLDLSNSSVIGKAMRPFTEGETPDAVIESHSHYLCGWVAGFSIRCLDRNGQPTEAFEKYAELREAMDQYPILDESDYSDREYEATVENIVDAAWRLKDDYDLPEDCWQYEVYGWLSDHESSEIENTDDQGGYPTEESLRRAMDSLFERIEEEE